MNIVSAWNTISVTWRWRVLLASMLLLFVCAYSFNIKKTIALVKSYNELKGIADTARPQLHDYQMETFERSTSSVFFQNDSLLKFISDYCVNHKIDIKEMSQSRNRQTDEEYTVATNKIVFSGTYQNILTLFFDIEKRRRIAILSSVNWELANDRVKGEHVLLATLFIKSIQYEDHGKE